MPNNSRLKEKLIALIIIIMSLISIVILFIYFKSAHKNPAQKKILTELNEALEKISADNKTSNFMKDLIKNKENFSIIIQKSDKEAEFKLNLFYPEKIDYEKNRNFIENDTGLDATKKTKEDRLAILDTEQSNNAHNISEYAPYKIYSVYDKKNKLFNFFFKNNIFKNKSIEIRNFLNKIDQLKNSTMSRFTINFKNNKIFLSLYDEDKSKGTYKKPEFKEFEITNHEKIDKYASYFIILCLDLMVSYRAEID